MDQQSASAQHGVSSKARLICTCSLYFFSTIQLAGILATHRLLQACSCSYCLTASFLSCNSREELLGAVM